jgi:hypothetical protein
MDFVPETHVKVDDRLLQIPSCSGSAKSLECLPQCCPDWFGTGRREGFQIVKAVWWRSSGYHYFCWATRLASSINKTEPANPHEMSSLNIPAEDRSYDGVFVLASNWTAEETLDWRNCDPEDRRPLLENNEERLCLPQDPEFQFGEYVKNRCQVSGGRGRFR